MANESEWLTRKSRIDPKLGLSGWPTARYQQGIPDTESLAVEEFPTARGPADYALCAGGRVLAAVEAKKVTRGPQGVLTQAERYSRGIDAQPRYQGEFGVPFLYSTNGEEIWFADVRHPSNRSRRVSGFHTPAALAELAERDLDADLKRLAAIPPHEIVRPYQQEAHQAIDQAIAERKRKMLVAMATGTGKTLMTVSEIYRLMKSGVARRVLFLVDRRVLAAQTVRAFASFEPEPGLKFDKIYPLYSQRFQRADFEEDERFDPNVMPNSLLTAPKLGDAFVYVCTVQRMSINLFGRDSGISFFEADTGDEDADRLNIPIHAFDLIVADECHRGYSAKELSVWRNTLDWFDAITIGLTATPAAHTLAQFDSQVFTYDFERAVTEGYLVDYDVIRINSDVRMRGVFLKDGEQIDQIDTETGARQLDLLEDERVFDASQVERDITAPDSNRKVLEEIKRYAQEHEATTGRFPKILVFAVNDLPHTSHADQLVEFAKDVFNQGDAFARKITGKVDRPLQRIREFRNRPNPSIVVTVDLLTTGVDSPNLEFLVFLRPVKSRILFEQMLGRGTRRSTDLIPAKTHFTVFDCFDGTLLEYFRNTTGMTVELPEGDGKTIDQIVAEIWNNRDREYNTRRLVKRLLRVDKAMSGEARELFARFVPNGDVGSFAESLSSKLDSDFHGTMQILRDPDFLKLCTDYPRPQRTFVVAKGVTDTVESQWLIKGGVGKDYKPEDYLQLFVRFVEEHREEIDAIQVLLSRPADWSPEALRDLRDKLATAPEHFTIANLQRAFHATHHKALVDIISMVKRAAIAESALLTAEERVDAAIQRIRDGHEFTQDQDLWLGYIRQHLVENLSIEKEDFDLIPVLSSHGGWGRADRAFDGNLPGLLAELNRELVAA